MITEATPIKITFSISDNGKERELFTSLERLLERRGHYVKTIITNQPKSVDNAGNNFVTYDILRSYYEESLGSDCILYDKHSPFRFLADMLGHKIMEVNLAPDLCPLKPDEFNLNDVIGIFSRISERISTGQNLLKSERAVSQFKKSIPLNCWNENTSIPSIYGVSNCLLEKPKEYPINSYFTGLWINNDIQKVRNLNPLLPSDKKIILIISPKIFAEFFIFKTMIKVCNDLGLYSIVALEPEVERELQPFFKEASMIVSFNPTDMIPMADVVIHPADVRVTMECMLHGKPSVNYFLNDLTSDQRFWTDLSFVNDCSLKSVNIRNLTENELRLKVDKLVNHSQHWFRCRQIAAALQKEDGLQKAIELIEMRFCAQFTFTKNVNYPDKEKESEIERTGIHYQP